jgi:hypothetical protein
MIVRVGLHRIFGMNIFKETSQVLEMKINIIDNSRNSYFVIKKKLDCT